MYLDSLSNAPPLSFSDSSSSSNNPPSTFGELLTTDMNDICAFNAASLDIQSTISSNGGITAAQIQESIRRANEVVSIIRQHFPGAMGSSEILERVKRVLDMYNAENILLTQSGKLLLLLLLFLQIKYASFTNDVCSLSLKYDFSHIFALYLHTFTNRKIIVCPDEINHEHGDITDLFIENIGGGKVFHLGGLAGVP